MLFIVPEKPLWRGINKVCMYVCLVKVKKNTAKTVYEQSCSTSDPKKIVISQNR